ENAPPVKQARQFWHGLGPGLTTGAADDDPSGVATYSQQGSKYGFQLLWLAPLTFPLMAVVQEMCARIGLATGRGLAGNIKKHFPKWLVYLVAALVLGANSFNIGADLGGMAKASQLLVPWLPFWFLVVGFVVLSLVLQIFISYEKYAKYLKYLALTLLVYVITAFTINGFPWGEVLRHTLTPSLDWSKEQFILITGILGTTISPYLFFWETSQEVEERIVEGKTTIQERQEVDKKTIKKMRLDVWTGMLFSNLVMFFIVAVCGATLFSNGITNINSAADAAAALKPLAGNYASLLFAIGIIATGLLGIPILAGSASYAVSESFGWKEGLSYRIKQAAYFYGIIILSMVIGLLINFIGLDPIKALIYAAVVNGLVAPVILVLICIISQNKSIMNSHHNSKWVSAFGWFATGLMIITGLVTIYSFF
ncbi:MAG: natural resistance-associated macrophage protein, partial [Candidatus Berkelbacteria bacterium]|nr:natural resistance-associated macrophage protein [Candidatus Berkelbacteria bacterium]